MRMRPRASAYAMTGAVAAAMALVALGLQLAAPQAPVFLLFAPIVCGAAIFGGLGPGLLAVALGLAAGLVIAPARGVERWPQVQATGTRRSRSAAFERPLLRPSIVGVNTQRAKK